MEIKIIHICEDEKFINSAIEQFEFSFPSCNIFYVLKEQYKNNYIHIKKQKCVESRTKNELIELAGTVDKRTIIVFHSLSPRFYDFVLSLPKENPVIWFCFGFEVYNDVNYYDTKKLLDNITYNKFPDAKISQNKKIKNLLRPYYRVIKKNLPLSAEEHKAKVLKRIDFLGSSFKEEFQAVCKLINQQKVFFGFWYYPLEQILNVSTPINQEKKTILIGNSGFKIGNHLDVFEKIKDYNLIAEKIIVPLNYGENEYINFVAKEGQNYFSDKFLPLLNFMSLNEYNNILDQVGIAIFNTRRQQAVGNTIALLWMGAKVFLSNKNPFYHFLSRIGVKIYCYETDLNEKSCSELLSFDYIQKNRSILFEFLNEEKLAKELYNQIYRINAG